MSWFFLIPVSIGLGLTGLGAFFWALRHDQYDDVKGDAVRILTAPDTPISHKERPHGKLAANPDHPDPDRGL
jgi:cbb3-type cytochrome oxidase maturation protein